MDLKEQAFHFLMETSQFPRVNPIDLDLSECLTVTLRMDTVHLMDTSPDLVKFLLGDHDSGCKLFEDVIQEHFSSDGYNVKVFICIHFISLPRGDPFYVVEGCQDFPKIFSSDENSTPKSLIGILTARSSISNYIKKARYMCSNVSCILSIQKQQVDLVLSTDANINTIKDKLICSFCSSTLVEDLRSRQTAPCVTCLFLPCYVLENRYQEIRDFSRGQFSGFHQPISVVVSEEWFPSLLLGQLYEVIGRPTYTQPTKISATPVLDCINITKISSSSARFAMLADQQPELTSTIFKQFKEVSPTSPWSFVGWLAMMFGESVNPRGTYFHLKLSILISMAMLSDEVLDGPLPMVVACADSLMVDRLLMYGLSICKRKVVHSIQNPLGCMIRKQSHGNIVEAGSLLLAQSGICYLGELRRIPKETLHTLQTVLERGEIRIEQNPIEAAAFDKNNFGVQDLRATTWALYTLDSSSRDVKDKFCRNMKALIDVFGMLIFPEGDNLDDDKRLTDILTNDIISKAANYKKEIGITDKEWKVFLLETSERRVSMSSEAEVLLKRYFVASRRARNGLGVSAKGTHFPQGAMNILTQLSKGHAKLALRSVVSVADAVAACRIYEMNISAQTGFALLGIQGSQNFFNVDLNFDSEYHIMMDEFQDRLMTFINECAEDSNISWEE